MNSETKLKNFDYDRLNQKVITTKSFYQRFGYYQTAVQQHILIDKVKRMLIHEALHLLGYNESQSYTMSYDMVHKMHLKEQTGDLGLLINSDDTSIEEVFQSYNESVVNNILENLKDHSIKNYQVSLENNIWECFLDTTRKSCDQEISSVMIKQQIKFTPKEAGNSENSIIYTIPMKYSFINSQGKSGYIEFHSPEHQFQIGEQKIQVPETVDVVFANFENKKKEVYINFICENESESITGTLTSQPLSKDSNNWWVKGVKLIRSPHVHFEDLPLDLQRDSFDRSITLEGRSVKFKAELWRVNSQVLSSAEKKLSYGFSYDYRNSTVNYVDDIGHKAFSKLICRPLLKSR